MQSPPTFKFRHGYFHEEDMKHRGYDLSPLSYSPSSKCISNTRYNNISISIGARIEKKNKMITPGPGQYNLPSVFDKCRKFKYALN